MTLTAAHCTPVTHTHTPYVNRTQVFSFMPRPISLYVIIYSMEKYIFYFFSSLSFAQIIYWWPQNFIKFPPLSPTTPCTQTHTHTHTVIIMTLLTDQCQGPPACPSVSGKQVSEHLETESKQNHGHQHIPLPLNSKIPQTKGHTIFWICIYIHFLSQTVEC